MILLKILKKLLVSKNKIVYLHYKILIMNKKYRIIVADPPWQYGSKSAVNNSNGSEIKNYQNIIKACLQMILNHYLLKIYF